MKVGDHQEDGSAKCQALPWRATLVMIMQARVGVVPPPVSPTQEVEAEGVSLKPALGYIVSKLQGNMNKNNKQTKKRKTHLKNQSIN